MNLPHKKSVSAALTAVWDGLDEVRTEELERHRRGLRRALDQAADHYAADVLEGLVREFDIALTNRAMARRYPGLAERASTGGVPTGSLAAASGRAAARAD